MSISRKADISVIILTKNEEERITRCIDSARFADEIVVVDSGSTDRTCDLAHELGARVVNNPWPEDFSVQRNFADPRAKHSWILHLDADEQVSRELAEEILDFLEGEEREGYAAGRMPRKELIFGRWIEHGGWYPQHKLRLYRKGSGTWKGRVHERFEPEGEVKTFKHPLLHDSYESVQVFLEKFNHYSTMDADEEIGKGGKFSLIKLFLVPLERFFGRYVRHRGYRDGMHGFVLAALIGLNYFIRYLKVWEKEFRLKNAGNARRERGGQPPGRTDG